MSPHLKRILWTGAKVALAAGLLAWVLSQVHWHDYTVTGPGGRTEARRGLETIFRTMDFLPAGLAVAVQMGSLWASSMRWRLLLGVQRVHITPAQAMRLQLLGEFFSNVIPGTAGGDVVKAWHVARQTPHKAAAAVTVLADRLLGLVGLAAIATAALAAVWLTGSRPGEALVLPAVSVGVVVAFTAASTAFLASRRLRRKLGLEWLIARLPLAEHLARGIEALRRYLKWGHVAWQAFAWTAAAQGLSIAMVGLLGLALGLDLAWYTYVLYVPLLVIITAVPLTPGSIGLMEKMYVLYLGSAGAGADGALALALLVRATYMVTALPGAIVAATGPRLPDGEQMREELSEP